MKNSFISKIVFLLASAFGLASAITDIETAVHTGYDLMTIRPTTFEPPVGGMEFLPDGKLLVLTWRGSLGPEKPFMDPYTKYGDLYEVSGVQGTDRNAITVKKIADGFKDALGILYVDGTIYVGDIDRLIKLVDNNGDGYFETKETFAKIPAYNAWFEFAFGPIFKDGKFYMSLCGPVLPGGMSQSAKGPGRSTVLSIDMQGKIEYIAGGFRAPNKLANGPEGEMFLMDNQGVWEPSSKLVHVRSNTNFGYRIDPPNEFSSLPVSPPAVWIPYGVLNSSATEPTMMPTGLYKNQFFFGDVKRPGIRRTFIEKVKGVWQGAAFPFSGGTESGIHRIRIDANGVIYMGGLGRDVWENWNGKTFGLQKLTPNGKKVFEMLAVRSRKNGMEIEFTQPVGTAADQAGQYKIETAVMIPGPAYGEGNMMNKQNLTVKSATVSTDRMRVFLEITGLTTDPMGRVVHITVPSLTSQDSKALWFNETWYTLNVISDSDPFAPDPVEIKKSSPPIMDKGLIAQKLSSIQYQFQAPWQSGGTLRITDLRGKNMFQGSLDEQGICRVDVSSWTRGIYTVTAMGKLSASRLNLAVSGSGN